MECDSSPVYLRTFVSQSYYPITHCIQLIRNNELSSHSSEFTFKWCSFVCLHENNSNQRIGLTNMSHSFDIIDYYLEDLFDYFRKQRIGQRIANLKRMKCQIL